MTFHKRCSWVTEHELYRQYHDTEWGVPLRDEKELFELLCLEGQQAGLSWFTVLSKRENYRQHFFNYSIQQIAEFTDNELVDKCQDHGLIRHIKKLQAIRNNAQMWLKLKENNIDVVEWLWSFVHQETIVHHITSYKQLPTFTPESEKMSKALKKAGFKFVGAVTCYAFMQASGMVNDHEEDCFCKK